MGFLLLLSALATSINGDVILSPDSTDGDVSISFGSHAIVSDSEWVLATAVQEPPENWAVEIELGGVYQFSNKKSTVSVTVDGNCMDTQCDMFWGFGDGNKYITFAQDFDGGLWVRNKNQEGMYAFPACGGQLARGDLTEIMTEYTSEEAKGFWRFRDILGQGDRTNFEEITTEHNDHTWPVTVEVTNDMDRHEVTFRFFSDNVDVECVYDDVFAPNTNLIAAMTPDVGQNAKDDIEIYSVSASIDRPFSPMGTSSFTPGGATHDVSYKLGEHASLGDSEFMLATAVQVAPEDWAVEVDLSGAYRFNDKKSTVTVTADGHCIDKQCDMFWGFGDGNKFITFAHDFDNGLWVRNQRQKGLYAFPPCGGSLAEGDLKSVFAQSTSTETKGFWRLRDNLAQGDKTRFEEISTAHNGRTWPVHIEVTNDMDRHEVTFRFYSDNVDVECVYHDAFAPNADLIVAITPDVGKNAKDDIALYNVAVNIDNSPAFGHGGIVHGGVIQAPVANAKRPAVSRKGKPTGGARQDSEPYVLVLDPKELMIIGLLVVNVVVCVVMAVMCMASRRRTRKYIGVPMGTESEMEEIQVE